MLLDEDGDVVDFKEPVYETGCYYIDQPFKFTDIRKSIDTYVQGIAIDNAQHIKEGGYVSIADYIISNAENGTGWTEYFDEPELEGSACEPTDEQIEELKDYLNENFNYFPE